MKWTKTFNESRFGFDILDESGKHIAFVRETTGDPEAEKNARMIEAVPEMFDLLTRANEADADGDDPPHHFWARVRKLLRHIIGEKKVPSSEPPADPYPEKNPQRDPGPVVKIASNPIVKCSLSAGSGGTGGNVDGATGARVNFHDRDREALLEVEKRARIFVKDQSVSTVNDLCKALRLLDEARTPTTREIAERIVGTDVVGHPGVRELLVSEITKALDEERERAR